MMKMLPRNPRRTCAVLLAWTVFLPGSCYAAADTADLPDWARVPAPEQVTVEEPEVDMSLPESMMVEEEQAPADVQPETAATGQTGKAEPVTGPEPAPAEVVHAEPVADSAPPDQAPTKTAEAQSAPLPPELRSLAPFIKRVDQGPTWNPPR